MSWVDLSINELIKADWNYKVDDVEISKALSNNIKKNGLIENLIVRKLDDKYEVVNGNHRLDVLKKLNYKDKIKCFNLGTISLNAAKRIAIETNETKFNSDKHELESILNDLAIDYGVDDIIESTIFDQSYFNAIDPKNDIHNDDYAEDKKEKICNIKLSEKSYLRLLKQINRLKYISTNEAPENVSDEIGFNAISFILESIDDENIENILDDFK